MKKQEHFNTIAIDIGGTFTDCFVRVGGRSLAAKAPTTHYDLSTGFMRALEDVVRQLGSNLSDLLPQIDAVFYSTTLAVNGLLERVGPNLGLITTAGFEDLILIGRGAQWVDGLPKHELRNFASINKPIPLIPRDRIVGIRERIDPTGNVLRPLDEDDLREKLLYLVDQSVRGIVVSLLWAHRNPEHELRVREIIEEEYPYALLGAVPVTLSHEVHPKKGEYERTMSAVLSAYLGGTMARDLGSIYEELRARGYRESIYIVVNAGGLAKAIKTRSFDTYNAGPVAGILGSMEIARRYGFGNLVTTDMGGTSFDIGVIYNGQLPFCESGTVIDRWRINNLLIESKSVGAGGGSIARINESFGKRIDVGPQSAGSLPGPACYNLGGADPTVTDADVVLGYIDPGFFHGGRMQLDKKLATQAIVRKIGKPLGLDAVEAAAAIKRLIDGYMGNIIFMETMLKGHDPKEFILFSFGGAGPTHCCGYSRASQIRRIVAFPFSPVFGAYSAAMLDVRHGYELSRRLLVSQPGSKEPVFVVEEFNAIIDNLLEEVKRDFRSEKLEINRLMFFLELEMKYSGQLHSKRIKSPKLRLENTSDVSKLLQTFSEEYKLSFGRVGTHDEEGVIIEDFILWATYPLKHPDFPTFPHAGSLPSSLSRKGNRMVFWDTEGRFKKTPIFDYAKLQCGNVIEGPAIVEADHTTFVISDGATFTMDRYKHCLIDLVP